MSCASYWSGYFNAYGRIAERDDLDLVVHCGDHIYDYPDDEEWVRARFDRFDPEDVDFRTWRSEDEVGRRYALHYADADVAPMRRTHPMVIAWDNHDLASGDDPGFDADATKRAFWRWTASRPPAYEIVDGQVVATDVGRGYRHLALGDVDLMVLDVRSDVDDTSILGTAQMEWLRERLADSAAAKRPWRVVVSPLPLGRFELLANSVTRGGSDETTAGSNYGQAHGAPARDDRDRFEPLLEDADAGSRGIADALVSSNASMHYANWTDHGYGIVEVADTGAVLESWIMPHLEPGGDQHLDARFTVAAGSDHVRPAG